MHKGHSDTHVQPRCATLRTRPPTWKTGEGSFQVQPLCKAPRSCRGVDLPWATVRDARADTAGQRAHLKNLAVETAYEHARLASFAASHTTKQQPTQRESQDHLKENIHQAPEQLEF